jgi:hypothetical protein
MGLATVIRLEFAYPGVGVLAGDSLQYLSIATAHGVIMVFYMIMPAIFGAFGNFLLPTQLGVHDVAFPRLNSAAFWFLPGGVIMLFQLVCTDRRYARMNCFNIRELQSVLKRKFFSDLVSSHDYRDLLTQSMLGLRFRLNSNDLISPDVLSFHDFGLKNSDLNKFVFFNNSTHSTDLGGTVRSTLTGVVSYELLVKRSYTILNSGSRQSAQLHYVTSLAEDILVCFRFLSSVLHIGFRSILDMVPSITSVLNVTLANLFNSFITVNFSGVISIFKNFYSNVYYSVASGYPNSANTIYMSKESHVLEK